MADTYQPIVDAQLPTSVGSIWGNGTGNTVIIKKITVSNNGAGAATAKLHRVRNGDTPDDSNVILPERTMNVGDVTAAGPFIVDAGGSIQGVSDTATSISVVFDGVELNP